MAELHKSDSDVLVGHNISGFDLDILLHRVQVGPVAGAFLISSVSHDSLIFLRIVNRKKRFMIDFGLFLDKFV